MKTTILVSPETRDQLRALGRKGESYDEVIRGLIEQVAGYDEENRALQAFIDQHLPEEAET